jgi:ADP-ribose pyrophosphatase YjhB (NUDIX family)
VIERVRAIPVTPANTMLAIRRLNRGVAPYWVLPGGHVEDGDSSLEAALRRELREELAGAATILRRVAVLEGRTERQHFYLAAISSWSFADRSGPEFSETGRGCYELEEIPLTVEAMNGIDLKPAAIATLIKECLHREGDILALPDLR